MSSRLIRTRPTERVVSVRGQPRMVVYVFGRFTRIGHWLRNVLLVWLVLSGFYLANPFLTRNVLTDTAYNFVQAQIRGMHVAAGWLLLALTLLRTYEFLFIKRDGKLGIGEELKMARILFNWRAWKEQLAFYSLLRRDHPNFHYSNYGPLQYLTYFVLYTALGVISVTGIILAAPYQTGGLAGWSANLLRPLEVALGGLVGVRTVHHWVMWFLIIFAFVHVYMVVWNSLRSGNLLLEGMISGFKAAEHDEGDAKAVVEKRVVTEDKTEVKAEVKAEVMTEAEAEAGTEAETKDETDATKPKKGSVNGDHG